jgi:hypothetical protein
MQGPGSKPIALHTEYATKDADWDAAYRGDVIFYLVRADQGGVKDKDFDSDIGDVDDGYVWSESEGAMVPQGTPPPPGEGPVIPANAQTGESALSVQTAPQQIAAAETFGATSAGPAGPVSVGEFSVDVGVSTQAAARHSTTTDSVVNVTQAVESASQNEVIKSTPASETFFNEMMHEAFNPGVSRSSTRTVEEIEFTLDSPKISDLSYELARASGGVRSTQNLIQGISRGDIGLVSPKMMGQAERFGPQVLTKRYTR